jgi:myo-inositol-1(or 4)-monophosphatase
LNVDADRSALAARDCLAAAAREAGALTLGFFRLGAATSAEVQSKFGGSPVTEADLAADALLKRRLREAFPEAGWLSEETADDPERLERRALLVIDPIDGTRAFVAGDPRWAVSVALVVAGRPVAAVVHAAAGDET